MGKSRENKATKKDKDKTEYIVKVSFGDAKLEYCLKNMIKTMENKMEHDIALF